MKLKKSEKIWLGSVLFFFIVYNMPFLPAYNNMAGTLIHGAFTLIPLWICVYAGLFKISDGKDPSTKDTDKNKEELTC